MTTASTDDLFARALCIEATALRAHSWIPKDALVAQVGQDMADIRHAANGSDWILALKEWAIEQARTQNCKEGNPHDP